MKGSTETFDSLWAFCEANQRIVPMPDHWNHLYQMLRGTTQKPSGGWEPPLPLILAAWHESDPNEKQERFKGHVRWAADQGQLDEIAAFLRGLPEEEWLHVGEPR